MDKLDVGGHISWPSPDDEIPFWKQNFGPRLKTFYDISASDSQHQHVGQVPDSLHVLHITAEMAPIAKVGGLGDVVTGLARACLDMGHNVEVMLPFYESIPQDQITDLTGGDEFSSFYKGEWSSVELFRGKVSGIPCLFIQPKNQFFKGSRIYGGDYDELEAYLFFTRACLEWMQVWFRSSIFHTHLHADIANEMTF